MPLLPSNEMHNCQKQAFTILKTPKTVSSQGQHWFIHKTSLSEQKDDEAENRLSLMSQLFLELYCTLSERPPQPLYPSCFEKLAGRGLSKALVAMSCTDREV